MAKDSESPESSQRRWRTPARLIELTDYACTSQKGFEVLTAWEVCELGWKVLRGVPDVLAEEADYGSNSTFAVRRRD